MCSRSGFTLTIILLALTLGGCDGRGGSSGFDATSENAAIREALATQQCVDFQGLRICSAASTAADMPRVETDLGTATTINCFQATLGGPCTLTVTFVPQAFASNTTFKVLARADTSSGPWVLGADPVPGSGNDASSLTATVVLTSAAGGPPSQVQLAILSFAGAPPAAPAEVQELHQTAATFAFVTPVLIPRTVLATGDSVPGFGSIGAGGFTIKAITNDGRVVVAVSLSDGRQAVFFADHRQLTPIWTSDQTPGITVDIRSAIADSTGTIAVPVHGSARSVTLFYVVSPGGEPHVVRLPATDLDANTLCYVESRRARVNRAGHVAFEASLAPPGRDCTSFTDSEVQPTAIYVTDGEQLSRVLSTPLNSPSGQWNELIGLTEDDAAIAVQHVANAASQVVAAGSGALHRIIGLGDPGPSGGVLSALFLVTANARGDIAFTASDGGTTGLYRTVDGRIVSVARPFVSPSGAPYTNLADLGAFSVSGDIAFAAAWSSRKADGSLDEGQGVVLYPAGGTAQIAWLGGRDTGFGWYALATGDIALSDIGTVAFGVQAFDGNAGWQVLTWSAGVLDTALVSGDAGPSGTVVAEQGLYWYANLHCLSADGRVAAVATSTTGHQGLVCTDANGPQLVVQSGTIAPDGFAFRDFADCRFTDDGGLVFSGTRDVPTDNSGTLTAESSVYRATTNGIERLFGDGDMVSNGSPIEDSGSGVRFIANAKGSILVQARAGADGLFLRHDGRLDVVRYGIPLQWGLADNDGVVMLDWLGEGRPPGTGSGPQPANTLLVSRNGHIQVIARADEAILPGAPFQAFANLMVRGNLAMFSALGGQDHDRYFWYRLADDTLGEVSVTLAPESLLDFTPGGSILKNVPDGFELVNADGSPGAFVSNAPPRSPDAPPLPPDAPALTVFGINDRGNVALYAYSNPPDSSRQTIELAGPAPDAAAHCPLPRPPSPGTPSPAPQTPTPTAAPIVGVGPYRAYVSDMATDTVTVIDTATQDLLATVAVRHNPQALAVSADGARLFVLADTWVDVIDTTSLQRLYSIPLGEWANNIVAAPEAAMAWVSIVPSRLGAARLVTIDGDVGLAASMVVPPGRVFGVNPSDGYLLAIATSGAPCTSQSNLMEIDPARATIVRTLAIGSAATAATVGADEARAYVADGCTGQLAVVDLTTFAMVESIPIYGGAGNVVVTRNGRQGYTTSSYVSYPTTPDGSFTIPQGILSAIDLMGGTSQPIAIRGGGTGRVAVTPDGLLAYATVSPSDFGSVAVVDTTRKTMVTSLLPAVRASDIVIAPAPSVAPPTPQPPRVVLQAANAVGVVGDIIPLVVVMHSHGLDVASIEHDLVAPIATRLQARSDVPDCWLNPAVAAVATFEFSPCQPGCNRVHATIRALELGTSLPHDGPLYTCNVRAQFPASGLSPILISGATAVDPAGQPLVVFGADSEVQVLSQGQATPRPTQTPPPSATPTTTATPTLTMPPVVIEIGSVTVRPGARVTVPVILHSNGAAVVGLQNDISFTATAPIAAAPSGKPDCAVNPAIAKPNTTFTFLPVGCDQTRGNCTSIRAVILSVDDLSPIADNRVLYTCVVETQSTGPVGVFSLHASAVVVSNAQGHSLPATAIDGRVVVSGGPPQVPTIASAATPTATDASTRVASPTPTPSSTVGAAGLSNYAPTAIPPLCIADCNGDGAVTVDELVNGIDMALGTPSPDACPNSAAFCFSGCSVGSGFRPVDITCLVRGVHNALSRCPVSCSKDQDCDPGNDCITFECTAGGCQYHCACL